MIQEQIQFIRDNSQKYTQREIAKILNCHWSTVFRYAKKNNIKFTCAENNSNIEIFENITKPEIAYFLGYCWADAGINRRKQSNNKPSGLMLKIVKDDALSVQQNIKGLFKYKLFEVKAEERAQAKTIIIINDAPFLKMLIEKYEFDRKSFILSSKMLNAIPEDIQHYFWRGFLDGDGCIEYGERRVSFSGSYNFDWSELIKAVKKETNTAINYSPRRRICGLGRSSHVTLRRADSRAFLVYIYKNSEIDGIGLQRKKDLYLKMMAEPLKRNGHYNMKVK